MNNFTELDYKFNLDALTKDVYTVIETAGWGDKNQICLTHPENQESWFIGSGGLITTKNFTVMNNFLVGSYYEQVHNTIKKDFLFTRVRLMNLVAGQCMSLHTDTQPRIHIPVVTNEQCLMIIDNEVKHMPAKGSAWLTNTLKTHTALNANLTMNRIHILFDLL